MIDRTLGHGPFPAPADGENALDPTAGPASPDALEAARRRALEVDRALAQLRASFREAPPAPAMPRPASGRTESAITRDAPVRPRDGDPAAELRRLVLDGYEAFCRGRHADALATYEQACRVAPARVAGYLGMGRTLLALKRFQEAREAYRQALEVDPDNAAARNGLADSEWRRDLPPIEPFTAPSAVRRPQARAPFLRGNARSRRN